MTDKAGFASRVLNTLGVAHRGKGHGIHANQLAEKMGMHGEHGEHGMRVVRKAIADLREMGIPIAGMPETGYFLAETAAELDDFCIKFLEGRAMHSLKLSSRLRKIPLPVLCGQLLMNHT